MGEVAGGKNICKASYNSVINGLTTIKKDVSTIIISGAGGSSRSISEIFNVKKGVTYTATFFTSSTNVTGFLWNAIKKVTAYIFGNSKTITFTPTEDETLCFAVTSTDTVSNVEISMQVEEGSKSTSFEPYIPSVKMLAEEVSAQNESLVVIGKCKNLLNPTLQTTTQNGITCTNNGDGTYTLNGTASEVTTFILRDMKLDSSLSYKLTGCPLGGDWDNGYSMYVEKQYWGIDVGKGCEITLTDASNMCGVYIRIIKGTVCNNLVFKPMITTNLNATYDDFVPYTGDGETLTHDVAELNNDLDKLNSLPKGSIIQIEADKDDIETTTQKYGWQYLGTSNIEYDNGSANILVTNVYRKNN